MIPARTPAASATPASPPSPARMTLSVKNCRTISPRDALGDLVDEDRVPLELGDDHVLDVLDLLVDAPSPLGGPRRVERVEEREPAVPLSRPPGRLRSLNLEFRAILRPPQRSGRNGTSRADGRAPLVTPRRPDTTTARPPALAAPGADPVAASRPRLGARRPAPRPTRP